MLITEEMARNFNTGFSDEALHDLFWDGKTPSQVATTESGPWKSVSQQARWAVLWYAIATENKPGMMEALARMLYRILPRSIDPRCLAVASALHEHRMSEEIHRDVCEARDSYQAVFSPYIWPASSAAAAANACFNDPGRYAMRAAHDAAVMAGDMGTLDPRDRATRDAARAAEIQLQMNDLVELLVYELPTP